MSRVLLGIYLLVLAAVGVFVFLPTGALVPSAAAAGAGWVALVALVNWLLVRRHPARPAGTGWAFVVAFVAGVLVFGAMSPVNEALMGALDGAGRFARWAASPIEEETLKLLAAVLVMASFKRIDNPVAAALIGMTVGFGFQCVENVFYVDKGVLYNMVSDADGFAQSAPGRVITPVSHCLYTALAAYGAGKAMFTPGKSGGWRFGTALAWFLAGYALHAANNVGAEFAGDSVAGTVFIIALLIALPVLGIGLYVRSRKSAATQASATPQLP